MEKDRSTYTGLPRKKIDWFPKIDYSKCKPEECGYHCVNFCPFKVFSKNENDQKVIVSQPYECNVGDESCKFQCPFGAISFPTREELKMMLKKVREKYEKQGGKNV
ncbi:MAG TPA: ferredoxin family protein [bacterium]|nr:ferredoxin family protein [bacterium]HOM26705.1 ferredoxin family protein [bacterium]